MFSFSAFSPFHLFTFYFLPFHLMEYEREILRVLIEAGSEGLSVQKISRHVFNACNSFFNPVAFDTIHAYVSNYLTLQSKKPTSLIEKTARRGVYRLNMQLPETQQLRLQFLDQEEEETRPANEDLSLPLFDF